MQVASISFIKAASTKSRYQSGVEQVKVIAVPFSGDAAKKMIVIFLNWEEVLLLQNLTKLFLKSTCKGLVRTAQLQAR